MRVALGITGGGGSQFQPRVRAASDVNRLQRTLLGYASPRTARPQGRPARLGGSACLFRTDRLSGIELPRTP